MVVNRGHRAAAIASNYQRMSAEQKRYLDCVTFVTKIYEVRFTYGVERFQTCYIVFYILCVCYRHDSTYKSNLVLKYNGLALLPIVETVPDVHPVP